MSAGALTTVRTRVYRALDPRRPQAEGLSWVNWLLVVLIVAASGLAILETEPLLAQRHGGVFELCERILGLLFATEYLARLWSAPERAVESSAWRERARFVGSPAAITDLVAIVASFASPMAGGVLLLRWVRLARIFRLAKLGRMSRALHHIADAVKARKDELALSLFAGLMLMVAAATALYLIEGAVQPEKFGSIPRALWWAVATMTTIGYGDVYPVTPLGKLFAAVTAVFSIGFIAMPTGILAAAFSDAMRRERSSEDKAS